MPGRSSNHSDEMALAIAVWICTLPLVGLLVVPFFGPRIALAAAVVLFVAILAACWGICGWKYLRS